MSSSYELLLVPINWFFFVLTITASEELLSEDYYSDLLLLWLIGAPNVLIDPLGQCDAS